jgi:calcineurin-like phosphoesterase family protein
MGNEPRIFDKFYFFSDPHWGHKNIISLSKRPFATIEEMNEAFIENYNRTVPKDGTVIWTGDCFFLGKPRAKEIMDRLHGIKLLVRGNHDMKPVDMYKIGFTLVCESMEMMIAGERVKISHFPYKPQFTLWQKFLKLIRGPKRHYDLRYLNLRPVDNGGWLIHGHTHNPNRLNGKQIHVGVDAWNYAPVSYNQIEIIINKNKPKVSTPTDR